MNDLISRQAAIEAVFGKAEQEDNNYFVSIATAKRRAVEVLQKLPSVQPATKCIAEIKISKEDLEELVDKKIAEIKATQERKTGKWVDAWRSRLDGTRYWYRECSVCGYERDDDDSDNDTNFCPNCGAEMRGDNNG